jgi:hypothetical protein
LFFLLVILTLPLVVGIHRSNELFVVEVRAGQARQSRGRLPRRLLQDIADIVAKPPAHGTLRALRDDGRARIVAHGDFGAAQLQQVRNVVGTYQLAQIVAGSPRARKRR